MTKYKYLLLVSLFCMVSACNNNSGNKDKPDVNDETEDVIPDSSFSAASTEKDSVPSLDELRDLNSALKYIEESPEREKYLNGIIPSVLRQDFNYGRRLLMNRYERFIIVDKAEMKVSLYDRFGRLEKSYGMACARNFGNKQKKADSRTPEGFFSVEGIYDSTEWLFTDDFGHTSQTKGQFGPRFIRIKCPSTSQIGIHGTVAPWSIGHRVSHGCIRVTNENILELVKYVSPGMPVIVNPSPKDRAVNISEGTSIPILKLGNRPESFYDYRGPLPKQHEETPPAQNAADSIPALELENSEENTVEAVSEPIVSGTD